MTKPEFSSDISPNDQATALKAADKILENWGCTSEQKQAILDIHNEYYQACLDGNASSPLGEAQLERTGLILNIHAALRTAFTNSANVNGFMGMINHNDYFNGQSPLDLINQGDIAALREVARRVSFMLSN